MTNNDQHATTVQVLALCRLVGIGPRLFDVLMSRFRSLDDIFRAEQSSLMAIDGISAYMARRIANRSELLREAEALHAGLLKRDISLVTRFDRDYPGLLFELNDPPPLLYVRGKIPDSDMKTVALVGAEKATNSGIELTVKVARR
ncbi:MAG: DNA-processing protein DprA, partial [Candidatus Zixiibacteriota bacterium]